MNPSAFSNISQCLKSNFLRIVSSLVSVLLTFSIHTYFKDTCLKMLEEQGHLEIGNP